MKKLKKENLFSVNLRENPDDYMESLRDNIKAYMHDCGYTIQDLADIVGITYDTFRTFLYGDAHSCKLNTVVALAREFGVSIDELVGSDTISAESKKSLKSLRMLPPHFRYYVRWSIGFMERQYTKVKPKKKAVNMLKPICQNGTMKPSNEFDIIDISDLPDDVRVKVFMGVKIPCSHYMPTYGEYHVLLLANDRFPNFREHCIASAGGSIWILNRREETEAGKKVIKYYSIIDGKFLCYEKDIDDVLGYVAAVKILE